MIFSTITFSKAGLDDPPQVESDDAITGLNCARWVMSWLRNLESAGFDDQPIAEDWGYAVRVSVAPETLLLGFANAFEDDPNRWRIIISDNVNRGLLPWTRQRRREAALKLSGFIERSLRATDGVDSLSVEQSG